MEVGRGTKRKVKTAYFFDHRTSAAFRAICALRRPDKEAALAKPPLLAPSFDRATAAGFFAGWGVLVVRATMLAAIQFLCSFIVQALSIACAARQRPEVAACQAGLLEENTLPACESARP